MSQRWTEKSGLRSTPGYSPGPIATMRSLGLSASDSSGCWLIGSHRQRRRERPVRLSQTKTSWLALAETSTESSGWNAAS